MIINEEILMPHDTNEHDQQAQRCKNWKLQWCEKNGTFVLIGADEEFSQVVYDNDKLVD